MASTSTSAGSSLPASVQYKPPTTKLAFRRDKRYHVFLSFRGPDVRKTLIDHLYQALSAAGLYVFIDSDKLEKGEIIGLSLEKAIESSAICIPIFSRDYAGSVWCLREAAAILSTCDFIIPLFYNVKPTEVRYPDNVSSPYKESFDKHLDRYTRKEIDGWKNALLQICERSGWTLDETQGYEAELVKKVADDLSRTFDRRPFVVAKHPVGMESVKNALIRKLNLSLQEVVRVGIWGIGGFGKTAVAKAVYNQIYAYFDVPSFIFNVRTNAAVQGLPKLQKQILKDLIKYKGQVGSVDEGKSLFIDRLGGLRVLLILDDVDDEVQLDALLGDWLAPGSRVIITSRNKHILQIAGASPDCIHNLSGLDISEGVELFSLHAFSKASPSPGYEDLSEDIVKACKGQPLSLEVIGSFLSTKNNDRGCWLEALGNITAYPRIHEVLYISYNALNHEEKEIFVDIACFFIGERKKLPIVFWKSLYKMVDTALCNLSHKLLIKIDDEGVFDMHDHLRDMGRTIAKEEKKDTRLWEAAHFSTISNNNNFSRLQLNGRDNGGVNGRIKLPKLERLCGPGLCYLDLQNLVIQNMTEDTLDMLPPSLIWLRLENCSFSIRANRATKQPSHSSSEDDIDIWQLKTLQLNFCPGIDNLSVSSLFSIPNIKLLHLDLRGCRNLINLPVTIGNLSQLQQLDLEGCVKLKNLPDTIGKLSQLEHLNLRDCTNLNNLPDTIGKLSQLQHLDLKGCVKLNNLPDTIDNLPKLEYLRWKDGKNVMFI